MTLALHCAPLCARHNTEPLIFYFSAFTMLPVDTRKNTSLVFCTSLVLLLDSMDTVGKAHTAATNISQSGTTAKAHLLLM